MRNILLILALYVSTPALAQVNTASFSLDGFKHHTFSLKSAGLDSDNAQQNLFPENAKVTFLEDRPNCALELRAMQGTRVLMAIPIKAEFDTITVNDPYGLVVKERIQSGTCSQRKEMDLDFSHVQIYETTGTLNIEDVSNPIIDTNSGTIQFDVLEVAQGSSIVHHRVTLQVIK